MAIEFFGYWRSLASFRVRIALGLKQLEYSETIVDLSKGEQFAPGYHAVNAQHVLPALRHDGLLLTQSLPIIEYLDETWPTDQPLLPRDAAGRARVRALAQITTADVHPLIVPRVRNYLGSEFGIDEPGRLRWIHHWFRQGSAAIEAKLLDGAQSGLFAHGNQISIADLALASHVVGCRLFKIDLSHAPTLEAIAERCLALDAFARAHPLAQPGAPASV
jgi:maleylacetoacetate isomerase